MSHPSPTDTKAEKTVPKVAGHMCNVYPVATDTNVPTTPTLPKNEEFTIVPKPLLGIVLLLGMVTGIFLIVNGLATIHSGLGQAAIGLFIMLEVCLLIKEHGN